MWPGGEFAYTDKKIKATFVQPLAPIPWNQRIDTIISWFTHATTPTNFVMMYLNEPDDHAHSYSPISDQVCLKMLNLIIEFYLKICIVGNGNDKKGRQLCSVY